MYCAQTFLYSLQFMPETFLILRRIQLVIAINANNSSRKIPDSLVIYRRRLYFPDTLSENTRVSDCMKFLSSGGSRDFSCGQTDRQT